jgi:hypothetical protein
MINDTRSYFNEQFTAHKYASYLDYFKSRYPGAIDFRMAETPIFIPDSFKKQMLSTGEYIIEQIKSKNFIANTNPALNKKFIVPNESRFPSCIVMDFAITSNEHGNVTPQLIELQGFPSLFGLEILQDMAFRSLYDIPNDYSPFLNGYQRPQYLAHLERMIKGDSDQHTVLLEIYPDQQKTRIDFYITRDLINIPIVCLSEIFEEDHNLFYQRNGEKIQIDRIYNRVVWDDVIKEKEDIQVKAAIFLLPLNIIWVTHPHHYYRISKFLLPFLKHEHIPSTHFLNEITEFPSDLNEWVLKPLFSYAGNGVKINVTQDDIKKIVNPSEWIVQKKVSYASVIETPNGPAKAEIRLFYFWDEPTQTYTATLNLARLSKNEMMGVDFNNISTWVGSTMAYFK